MGGGVLVVVNNDNNDRVGVRTSLKVPLPYGSVGADWGVSRYVMVGARGG